MSAIEWITLGWLALSVVFFGAVTVYDFWEEHQVRARARAHLARERAATEWVRVWEDTFAQPARNPRRHA